ncbi:hypothetical protein AJ80_06349 [Polytolypa hystricis UAMH7299]|uniref:Uncharacterized protein n=1 Tax=Polytolypa hystricis (strain UAMH7299) TaxID=1447883 RepID=A0A2B7XWN3_POLH7|nr:hypothetical protein AJ80_06349 [Polytolypa hystricis UAMH7299]
MADMRTDAEREDAAYKALAELDDYQSDSSSGSEEGEIRSRSPERAPTPPAFGGLSHGELLVEIDALVSGESVEATKWEVRDDNSHSDDASDSDESSSPSGEDGLTVPTSADSEDDTPTTVDDNEPVRSFEQPTITLDIANLSLAGLVAVTAVDDGGDIEEGEIVEAHLIAVEEPNVNWEQPIDLPSFASLSLAGDNHGFSVAAAANSH